MKRLLIVAPVLLAIVMAPAAGVAQNKKKKSGSAPLYQEVTADDVVNVLEDLGATDLTSTLDSYGDPEVGGQYDGINFSVRFYKCDAKPELACKQVQFRVSFDMELETATAIGQMNDWNNEWVFGKAYANDDATMILEHAVYVTGGVTRENLVIQGETWLEIMVDFAEHIGWR